MKQAVLLVDHGSRRQEANEQLLDLAERVRARLPDRLVETAHLDVVEPTIGQGIDACAAAGAEEVVVHPFFLSPGRHTQEDIPRLVAEAAARHPTLRVRVGPPLGLHDSLVEAVVARIGEA